MLKSLQHKRFMIMQNDKLSSPGCYWYVPVGTGIELIANLNDSNHKRPCYFYT